MTRFEDATCIVPSDTTILALEEQLKVHYATSEEKGVVCLCEPNDISELIKKGIIKQCVFVLDYSTSTWSSLKDVDVFLKAISEYVQKECGGIFIFESLLWNIYNSAYSKNLFYTSRHTGNPLVSANMFKGAVQENAVLEVNLLSDLTNDAAVVDSATGFYILTQKLAIDLEDEIECKKEHHKAEEHKEKIICEDPKAECCIKKLTCKVAALQRTIAYIIILGAMAACVLLYYFFNCFAGIARSREAV